MNILDALLNFLKKGEAPNAENTPEGLCPNCWGRSEYGGQFYETVKNNSADGNTANPDVGWVQDYANKHLSAIELKAHEEGLVCQKCKTIYRPAK